MIFLCPSDCITLIFLQFAFLKKYGIFFLVKHNKYFSPIHIQVAFGQFLWQSLKVYKLDRYVGSFCATHRLAQVVLLLFKVEILNHNSIYSTFPFICRGRYLLINFRKHI